MKNLYIYAYPAQMLIFQLIENDKILFYENCAYEEVIRTAAKYLKQGSIENILVIGETVFADKIGTMLNNSFGNRINIERIKNA